MRNAEGTLSAALDSLVTQTLADFEILLLNDGSTDRTLEIARTMAARDSRLRILETAGAGLVSALNQGLTAARGSLIARMDGDDVSLPTRLEKSVHALEQAPALCGVGTGVEIFREDRPPSPNLQAYARWLNSLTTPEVLFRERYVESPLCHPSVLLRREVLERANGWREGPFPEDWDLWLRLLESGHQLRCLPETLLRWRDTDARVTRTDGRLAWKNLVSLKAEHLARRFPHTPLVIWGAGKSGRWLSQQLQSRGAHVVAMVEVNAAKVGQTIHGAPVISYRDIGAPEGRHLLASVGAPGARAEIRAALTREGWLEGRDFTCVA